MNKLKCPLGLTSGALVAFLVLCDLPFAKGCEPWEWKCRTGGCITLKSRCNGEYECIDKSDEEFCARQNYAQTTSTPECASWTNQCDDGNCYYREWHCDGTRDCDDGTDERSCPPLGGGLMPTSSIIGMSVTVGGLFLLLIGIIVMITCVRRKHGGRVGFRRRRDVNETMYPGNSFHTGAIACPTISGEIVMREPPPRYTSQPDIYSSRPAVSAAAVNLAFSSDEPPARPPPCYSSYLNLVNDSSNISLCSSVEPPPSYTSQQNQNGLNTTIEGAINLSFCPDEGDYSITPANNHTMDSSYYSVHSMKSWADNLDAETASLGSQITEHENSVDHSRRSYAANTDACQNRPNPAQPQRVKSSLSVHTFQKSHVPEYPTMGYSCAAKMSSRVQRAKALGRQYSSTPMLVQNNYPTAFNRRVSIDTGDIKVNGHKVASNDKYLPLSNNSCAERRVKSAVQLDQKHESDTNPSLQREPNKAESTTCCHSRQNIVKTSTGSQGLKFWRNNNTSMSKACVSRCRSEASFPEMLESDEGFQEDSDLGTPDRNNPSASKSNTHCATPLALPGLHVPLQAKSHSLSHLYLSDMNSLGSNNSVNSWIC